MSDNQEPNEWAPHQSPYGPIPPPMVPAPMVPPPVAPAPMAPPPIAPQPMVPPPARPGEPVARSGEPPGSVIAAITLFAFTVCGFPLAAASLLSYGYEYVLGGEEAFLPTILGFGALLAGATIAISIFLYRGSESARLCGIVLVPLAVSGTAAMVSAVVGGLAVVVLVGFAGAVPLFVRDVAAWCDR